MTENQRVALVTGANKGIGFAIVRALCKQLSQNDIVYLTSRDVGRGSDAVRHLEAEGLHPKFLQLDILDEESIRKVCDYLRETHGGLDILVNNAAIAFKKAATEPKSIQAPVTVETNLFGVLRVCRSLVPLIRSHGRIVNMSSQSGSWTYSALSAELKERFKSVDTEQGLTDLMDAFIRAAKDGTYAERGWGGTNYGVSKLGLICLTRIQAQDIMKDPSRQDVLINCCCPGMVRTDMSSGTGSKDPDEGAVTPVYLALLPPGSQVQGKFLFENKELNFW